jgi:hypothetical protein
METTVAAGAVSILLLEVIKYLIWQAYGNQTFDFPAKFYAVAIPVLNVAVVPALALLGFEGYTMPTDWQGWGLGIVRVLLGSLVTLVGYTQGLKPLKEYAESRG